MGLKPRMNPEPPSRTPRPEIAAKEQDHKGFNHGWTPMVEDLRGLRKF
jgi:hypothetical protein